MYYKNQKSELFFEPSAAVIDREVLTQISKSDFDAQLEANKPPPPAYSIVTKLQAVRYWQANGLWAGVKTMLATDEDLNDRWIAASELNINDPDVIALGAAIEQSIGVTLQEMFNSAAQM